MRGLAWFVAAVALSTGAHGQSGALDLLSSVGGRRGSARRVLQARQCDEVM